MKMIQCGNIKIKQYEKVYEKNSYKKR